MTQSFTEEQLRTKICQQTVNGVSLHYSIVKKQQRTISIMSNERLLILDAKKGILFYINDYKKVPFLNEMPKPKNNEVADLHVCIYKNPVDSTTLEIKHAGKNSQGETVSVQWILNCETKELARDWVKLIEKYKEQKMNEMLGEKQGGKAFVHDTLSYGLLSNLKPDSQIKESIVKIQERNLKHQEEKIINQNNANNLSKSRIQDPQRSRIQDPQRSRISDPQKSDIQRSQVKIIQKQPADIENEPIQFSRLAMQSTYQKKNPSNISQLNEKQRESSKNYSLEKDWNFKFLKYPHQQTIFEYQQAAENAFFAILEKDRNNINDPKRIYEQTGLKVLVSNAYSRQATNLKRQFRNYHFIIESNKAKFIIGVPMCCLIQYDGLVGLVKAPFPSQAQQLRFSKNMNIQLRDLQRYTRITNSILQKGTLHDLTPLYGSNGQQRLIYVDNLIEYLPINVDERYNSCSFRPEFVLDHIEQVIPGGDVKSINKQEFKSITNCCDSIDKMAKQLAVYLSTQQTIFTNSLELKDIFHNFGVNMKYLPRVYNQVTSKHVKKYIHTIMIAKIAKDFIFENLIVVKKEDYNVSTVKVLEESLRLIIEGNNSNSSEIWKEISLRFKKAYSIPINNTELIGGFFLNSLMKLLRANFDLTKLNKNKKIFKEDGIISNGFIQKLRPKTKSYYRFTTEFLQKIKYACREEKKSQKIAQEIITELNLKSKSIPIQFTLNNNDQYILEYLSYYTPPSNIDANASLQNINIYKELNSEPPTNFSLRISKNYLTWCNKKQKNDEFKKRIEECISIVDYWLEEGHLHHCEIFQILSDYYANIGNNEESINFMKQSLSTCLRTCGAQSKQAGNKYFELADRELRAGRKKDALENFQKAKLNMESNQNIQLTYPILLMKLASLHLNNGNIQNCIEFSMNSIKNFQEYQKRHNLAGIYQENYKIKGFQILSRAYELSAKKNQFRDMAFLCAKKFNKTKNSLAFEQMIRICLTAMIFRSSAEKCKIYITLIDKILQDSSEKPDANKSLEGIMALAENYVVMERYLNKFENIERIINEFGTKRSLSTDSKDFVEITMLILGCIGEDYIFGLIQQKQYE